MKKIPRSLRTKNALTKRLETLLLYVRKNKIYFSMVATNILKTKFKKISFTMA